MRRRFEVALVLLAGVLTSAYLIVRFEQTTSGGGWHVQKRPAPTDTPATALNAIDCPGVTVCYAVGGAGTILATNDAGNTWRKQSSGTKVSLVDVACPTMTVCLAVGQASLNQPSSLLIKTTTAGRTWAIQKQSILDSHQLSSIACPKPSLCYAIGDAGAILTTRDSGQTWIMRTSHTRLDLSSIACPSANVCTAVGGVEADCEENVCSSPGQGVIVSTSNGGTTWRRRRVKEINLWSVACPSKMACYATGWDEPNTTGDDETPVYLVTRNSGQIWTQLVNAPSVSDAIACPSTKTCYSAVGNTVVGTTDGGASFITAHPVGGYSLTDIACPSTHACYAVGDGGVIIANTARHPMRKSRALADLLPNSGPVAHAA